MLKGHVRWRVSKKDNSVKNEVKIQVKTDKASQIRI